MAQLREASSVIMLRRTKPAGFEVYLLRRRKGASFMASAYVFPGGGAEPGEDARTAAARELFEEAGVLLARMANAGEGETLEMPSLSGIRKQILDGGDAVATLAQSGLVWSTEVLVPWSHWITPSLEAQLATADGSGRSATSPKRFSARFFVCELPPGQKPRFDDIETVDEVWVTPADAIARAKELALPPPQVRTCWELAEHATIEDVLAAGKLRSEEPHPILPRFYAPSAPPIGTQLPTLLLPWDPDYTDQASGDAAPLAYRPAWARGPSRFVLEDLTWKHVAAPGSTSAGSS